jgi:hypothetical protein
MNKSNDQPKDSHFLHQQMEIQSPFPQRAISPTEISRLNQVKYWSYMNWESYEMSVECNSRQQLETRSCSNMMTYGGRRKYNSTYSLMVLDSHTSAAFCSRINNPLLVFQNNILALDQSRKKKRRRNYLSFFRERTTYFPSDQFVIEPLLWLRYRCFLPTVQVYRLYWNISKATDSHKPLLHYILANTIITPIY